MTIELTGKEYRRLLDMVYIGNWVLNSARGNDRFEDYDIVSEKIFSYCKQRGLWSLIREQEGHVLPSHAFEDGGIHEAIADYEDAIFFDILAEELARRDMNEDHMSQDDIAELAMRMEEYITEFEQNGVENISLDI